MENPERQLFMRQISKILEDAEESSESPHPLDPPQYHPRLDVELVRWRERFMIPMGVIGAVTFNVFLHWGSPSFHSIDNLHMVGVATIAGGTLGFLAAEELAQIAARISTRK